MKNSKILLFIFTLVGSVIYAPPSVEGISFIIEEISLGRERQDWIYKHNNDLLYNEPFCVLVHSKTRVKEPQMCRSISAPNVRRRVSASGFLRRFATINGACGVVVSQYKLKPLDKKLCTIVEEEIVDQLRVVDKVKARVEIEDASEVTSAGLRFIEKQRKSLIDFDLYIPEIHELFEKASSLFLISGNDIQMFIPLFNLLYEILVCRINESIKFKNYDQAKLDNIRFVNMLRDIKSKKRDFLSQQFQRDIEKGEWL